MPYDHAPIATENYKGHFIAVTADSDPLHPREDFDNASTMVCFHRRYKLGDEHSYDEPLHAVADICNVYPDELERDDEKIKQALDDAPIYWLPLYLYDHSGITISTAPFSCPWDSGQVGIAYITKEKARMEGSREPDETDEAYGERVLECIRNEVKIYDQFLTGSVYHFAIYKSQEDCDNKDDPIESCGGIFGTEEDCLKEARELIDAL